MPIAAVPQYLGNDFDQASPGMRFGMYLRIWGIHRRHHQHLWTTHDIDIEVRGQERKEREVKIENKRSAIDEACKLTSHDTLLIDAWHERQQAAAAPWEASGRLWTGYAQAVAPFATGLGNEHPTENGFAFLWPYGLPYLPGSGVKGVLRRAARELPHWDEACCEALFGNEPPLPGQAEDARRGALSFWDVLPRISHEALRVEVMTPHQSHYYQAKTKADAQAGDTDPHDSGSPNPIFFLTVPPGSEFVFRVACDLDRLPESLRDNGLWQQRLREAFEHAYQWLGFGAKTAVGYGAMRFDEEARRRVQDAWEKKQREQAEAEAQRQREQELNRLSPAMREVELFRENMQKRYDVLKGKKTKKGEEDFRAMRALADKAKASDWSAEERAAAADAIEHWGPKVVQIDVKDLRKDLDLKALRSGG
ncbi:type III-B CRISPR module RAMP protein Cmr6 [Caldimonas sp.]|uniref:type III-B CRISPR module RAMP protein Cmr6 n=1 Tax=Caldimonas sp. TaxID=2838790 RepID=UPI00307E7C55